MGRQHVFVWQQWPAQRGHLFGAIAPQRLNERVDGGRVDEGLIALHVDHDVARHLRCELRQPVGAGKVVGTCQAGDAAELLDRIDDPLVVGRHDHDVDRRETGTAVDVLDHRPAVNGSERLTGKAG